MQKLRRREQAKTSDCWLHLRGVWLPVLYSQTRDQSPRAVNETLSNMRLRRFAAKLVQCFTHEGKAVFIGDEKIFKNVPRRRATKGWQSIRPVAGDRTGSGRESGTEGRDCRDSQAMNQQRARAYGKFALNTVAPCGHPPLK